MQISIHTHIHMASKITYKPTGHSETGIPMTIFICNCKVFYMFNLVALLGVNAISDKIFKNVKLS